MMLRFRPALVVLFAASWCGNSVVSAFPGADYPWIAPNDTQARSPCPGLNTAANHGFLPRSGRDISMPMLAQVLEDLFSFNTTETNGIFQLFALWGLKPGENEQGEKTLISLEDLYDSRFLHDACFVHEDPGLVGVFPPTSSELWEELKAASSDGIVLTHEDMLRHQIDRLKDSLQNNPETSQKTLTSEYTRSLLAGEKLFILLAGGHDRLEEITLVDAEEFLVHNRLPQGYSPRQERNLPEAVVDFRTDFTKEIHDYFYEGMRVGLLQSLNSTEETESWVEGAQQGEQSSGGTRLSPILTFLASICMLWVFGDPFQLQ